MAGSLAACATQGGTTEERMGSNLVSPGKFRFYSCEHLARQTVLMTTRAMELEGLIAKAGPGAGGSFVSAIAYRPEYLQVRGNLVELRKEQAEKNCAPPPTVAAPVHPAAAKPRARPKRS
ncbi:MAG: hypothetical protein Q8M24_05630 [Pseudolabrys sp.]|nr:hypothetical protein [Pseudolabrys sp.]